MTDEEMPAPKDNVSQEEKQCPEILPGFATFSNFMKAGFKVMKDGIKSSNSLPNEDNFKYYTCFPSFNKARKCETERILNSIQKIIKVTGAAGDIRRRDLEEKLELLVEVNDILLDRANACMNETSGIKTLLDVELIVSQTKKSVNINGSWNNVNPSLPSSSVVTGTSSVRLLGAKNVQRPQMNFKDKIDNSPKPWCPRITEKPNALKPLSIYLEEHVDGEVFCHPYEHELNNFEIPDDQFEKQPPIKYKSLEETPLIMIGKESDLTSLLNDLCKQNEIAIDLEHHSYRSFQGITCLMQISTRNTDYIIDTLTLRSELHRLNDVFTDPSILKVFHGAESDIQWLQRDLSLYVVNMFDTYQAGKQLELPYLNLAYLLKMYCGLEPNKHFQLADWRIRPLPQELLKYAREDTHYLLYIKDILRNALIDAANGQRNILKAVYDRSTQVCKKKYIKPVWSEESCMRIYRKSQKMFNNRQLFALKELHKWRDTTAREEDDSINYVLPNHMLLNIAEILPKEMQGILACCNPIPPLVRQNSLRLHKIILKAREQPLIKPVLEEDIRHRMTLRSHVTNNETWIYYTHDLPQGLEHRADLTCLLDVKNPEIQVSHNKKSLEHSLTVFDSASSDEDEVSSKQTLVGRKRTTFVSPFERYKRVLPMIAEHEAEERRKQAIASTEEIKQDENNEDEKGKSETVGIRKDFEIIDDQDVPLSRLNSNKRKFTMIENEEIMETSSSFKIIRKPKMVDEESSVKRYKREIDESETQEVDVEVEKVIQPLRIKKKGQKKEVEKKLKLQGMLPSKQFIYKSVDFSSFQGGSKIIRRDNDAIFRQQKEKFNYTRGKRKRTK